MTRNSDKEEGSRSKARKDEGEKSGDRKRSRFEGMGVVPDMVKKMMVSGLGAIFMTEETIRSTLSDMPKDAVNFLVNQADQTKDQLLNLIAGEVREFLESADLSEELAKVLARLTLDIHTKIRFVASDAPGEGLTVKPDMSYDVQVARKPKPRSKD